jgi:hypothetical protein
MKKQEDLFEELQRAYNRYFDILRNGCYDPTWEDGTNINLCANHFHYYKERIKEKHTDRKWACLDWIYETLLIEVPRDYMARQEEIRAGALKALAVFEADKNLLTIKNLMGLVSKAERDSLRVGNIFGYYTRLKLAIDEGDLVAMRGYEKNYESYLESFEECAKAMQKLDFGLFGE